MDCAAFVERQAPAAYHGGAIVGVAGEELGRHRGVHGFTVGQRRGLGLTPPRPLYVFEVRPETRTVVVGDEEALLGDRFVAGAVNWLSAPEPAGALRAEVQIRSRHVAAPATLRPSGDRRVEVVFDEPQRAITPGLVAVFYDGEVCRGGGWIRAPDTRVASAGVESLQILPEPSTRSSGPTHRPAGAARRDAAQQIPQSLE